MRPGDPADGNRPSGGARLAAAGLAVVAGLAASFGSAGGQELPGPGPELRVEEVRVPVEGAVLSGRLLIPGGGSPGTSVLLVPGSRDSRNLPGLGEELARRGLLVLDLDKRGVGSSTGSWRGETLEQRRDDVLAAVSFLSTHPEVDPDRIGVIGHSQGGYVAPMAAAESDRISFIVLLAGPAQTVRDQVLTHRRITLEREGASEEVVENALEGLERRLNLARRVRRPCRALRLSYVCGMIDHDPTPWLEAVQVPVLALFTAFDDMVPPNPNVALMEAAFARGGNRDVTIHVFPEGCHAFMPQAGPLEPMFPGFVPGFLDLVWEWTRDRSPAGQARADAGDGGLPDRKGEVGADRQGSGTRESKRLILPLPILYRMPETGWAGGTSVSRMSAVPAREGRRGSRAWDEVSVVYTEKGQFVASLATDRHRAETGLNLFGMVGASHFPSRFYGTGGGGAHRAGEPYTASTLSFQAGLRRPLGEGLRAGGGVRISRYALRDLTPEGLLAEGDVPGSTGGVVAALTLAVGVDTRDRLDAPGSGRHSELRVRLGEGALIGEYPFAQVIVDERRYLPAGRDHVLALQLFATSGRGRIPFQELPSMGGPVFMRGYHPMHHMDRTVVGLQGEYRSPFVWRFGAVAFGGVGGTSDGVGEMGLRRFKPSAGAGLRFALDRPGGLNLRADYGVGRGSSALYLGIREAF